MALSRRVEVGLRVLVVVASVLVLPRIFAGDAADYWRAAEGLSLGHLPYRDFEWQFPPLSAVALLLVPLSAGSPVVFTFLVGLLMAACEYASLCVVRRARPADARAITVWWTAVAVPLGAIAYFRLDHLAVLPATIAVVQLHRGRGARAAAAGFAAKLWPLAFVVGYAAAGSWRRAVVATSAALGVVTAWWAWSPEAVRSFVGYRQGGGFNVESVPGAILLIAGREPTMRAGTWVVGAQGLRWLEALMTVALAVAVVVLSTQGRRWGRDPVAVTGAAVVALLVTSPLVSPQFLTWVLPFAAWSWAQDRRPGALLAAAVWITLVFVAGYDRLLEHSLPFEALVLGRNALLVAVGIALARSRPTARWSTADAPRQVRSPAGAAA